MTPLKQVTEVCCAGCVEQGRHNFGAVDSVESIPNVSADQMNIDLNKQDNKTTNSKQNKTHFHTQTTHTIEPLLRAGRTHEHEKNPTDLQQKEG